MDAVTSLIVLAVLGAVGFAWFGREHDSKHLSKADLEAGGGALELTGLLAGGPLAIRRVAASQSMVSLALEHHELVLRCHMPPKRVPTQLNNVQWDSSIGWVVDVADAGQEEFRIYASTLEVLAADGSF